MMATATFFISAGKTVAEIAHPAGKSREIGSPYDGENKPSPAGEPAARGLVGKFRPVQAAG
jgi:hypothetical protein